MCACGGEGEGGGEKVIKGCQTVLLATKLENTGMRVGLARQARMREVRSKRARERRREYERDAERARATERSTATERARASKQARGRERSFIDNQEVTEGR